MKNSFFYLLILAGFSPVICFGLEPSLPGRYHPIGLLESPLSQAAARGYHPIKASDRVFLPGLRPQSAELLQQTLSERYPRTVGGSPVAIANKAVPKIFSDSRSFAQTRGIPISVWLALETLHSSTPTRESSDGKHRLDTRSKRFQEVRQTMPDLWSRTIAPGGS